MMIEAGLNGDALKKLVKGLSLLVSEARWHFNEFGLKVVAVDPANVAMIIASIPADSFDVYSISDEEVVIGVDINRVNEITKKIPKGDSASLSAEVATLKIGFGKLEYSVALIDPAAIRKSPKVPSLDTKAEVVVDPAEFKRAIELAGKISEHVVLEVKDGEFVISAKESLETIRVSFDDGSLISLEGGNARSMFGVEYIQMFTKVANKDDELHIHLGTDYPGKFSFVSDSCRVEYILAPRLEQGVY
ncbi:DNA polymerase sliding clamp [Geoglobus acetivorans]|uniref:DNA polymerase sliding clamp n=1 Tax=Geoglobus acetivorans TaxID=565033 RepID=A0A0A7GG46_GEOAI|nr:DNA polymerase sliding clamp protein PCNA [Geoglobus acetivorans]